LTGRAFNCKVLEEKICFLIKIFVSERKQVQMFALIMPGFMKQTKGDQNALKNINKIYLNVSFEGDIEIYVHELTFG